MFKRCSYSATPLIKFGIFQVVKKDFYIIISGVVFSAFLALIILSGYPEFSLSISSHPFVPYAGDGLSHTWIAQRAIEGWIFDNPRSGYPFGSIFLDYPGSDSGNILKLKILGSLTGNVFVAINIFVLTSFSLCFFTSYVFARVVGLSIIFSFIAAFAFSFLPFHFYRLSHLFYLSYFVVPVFFYLSILIIDKPFLWENTGRRYSIFMTFFLSAILLASFGVYYALFGLIIIVLSTLYVILEHRSLKVFIIPFSLVFGLFLGVALNISPNVLYVFNNGSNPEVAVRAALESEVYGLKFMQLIMPHDNHFFSVAREIVKNYNSSTPLINENHTSSLGVVGAIGFLLGLLIILFNYKLRFCSRLLFVLSAIMLVSFLFGTIGGLGSLFSHVISPSIRGWNRISVFIAFSAICIFFITLQFILNNSTIFRKIKFLAPLFSFFVCLIVIVDLVPIVGCVGGNCNYSKYEYLQDKDYVEKLESYLPEGSAIYQMPYISFPESPPINNLGGYAHLGGFLHSKNLRWSSGGMKGRDGDLFFRKLSEQDLEFQLNLIQSLGFSGISIDGRGYTDDDFDVLVNKILKFTEAESIISRKDNAVKFIPFKKVNVADYDELSFLEIVHELKFDGKGLRSKKMLSDYYYFSSEQLPSYLFDIEGLSGFESWGRWADKNISPEVKLEFFEDLPNNFTIELEISSLIENTIFLEIFDDTYKQKINSGPNLIKFEVGSDSMGKEKRSSVIRIYTELSKSPKDLGINSDDREIAFGLISLRII